MSVNETKPLYGIKPFQIDIFNYIKVFVANVKRKWNDGVLHGIVSLEAVSKLFVCTRNVELVKF